MQKTNIILETERCIVRPFTQEDAENLMPILGSEAVMHYSMTGAMDLSTILTTIEDWIALYERYGFAPWAVMHNNMLIGYAGLDIRVVKEIEQVQITFRLAESHWGQGFATELAIAIRDYAFTSLGLSKVIAIIDPDNQASIRTISKIGMRFEKAVIYGGLSLHVYKVSSLVEPKTKL
jgi:ribosomal-protein-alanine N-acetyltransferase